MSQDNYKILRAARIEIDKIDDEIHQLLICRESAVHKIALAKTDMAKANPIRFEREAQILRRLYKNHKKSGSHLPFMAIVRIWHELIAAYTLLQNHYEIKTDARNFAIARQQFGEIVKISEGNFLKDKLDLYKIWVLPHPKESNWWSNLNSMNILASLPFVHEQGDDAEPLAYVVGESANSFSSDDGSLDVLCLKITCDEVIKLDHELIQRLAKHDICGIAVSGRYLYCERHGVLPAGADSWENQLTAWRNIEGIAAIEWLGIYAKALTI